MAHWDTSEDWDKARRSGYTPVAEAEVWLDGALQTTLQVTGGSVTCDESSKTRRTLNLPIADVDLNPRDASDLLAPFGTEVHVFAGMEYSGVRETVPVGVFSLETTSRQGWRDEVSLTGPDRSGVLSEARFLTPWNTYEGALVLEEIAAMVLSVLPQVEVYDLTGSEARCRAASWDRDRWEAIDNLAKGIGAEAFFDQAGRFIIRDVTTVADLTVFGQAPINVYPNADDADLIEISTSMTRTDVYNAVVASSDQEVPVSAIAYQQAGPLRYRPGFQKPRFFSTPVVTTFDGIAKSALSILARSIAYSRSVNGEVIPDAGADAGSLVNLTEPGDDTGTLRILSAFTLPLGTGGMSISTRIDADAGVTDDGGSLE